MKRSCSRFALFCAFVAIAATGMHAEEWATGVGSCFAKGDKIIDVGIPFPFFQIGAHGAFDYAFLDAISAGGGIGVQYTYPYLGGDVAYLSFVLRGAFHPFNLSALRDKIKIRDRLDVYGGLALIAGPALDGNSYLFPVREFLGARWHFSPKISCFLEDCGGFGYLDGGISFNL
jgi:hypothetical protein